MSDGGAAGERFVVQRAAGKKWETVTVHDAQADGAAAFASAVRGAPRAFLRLIRLQADPDARGEVYDWTLVSLHDPRLALDGGGDGLGCYRAIACDARRLLKPDGHLVVELGVGQAAAVIGLFTQAGLACAPPRPDLAGVPRALAARRAA